jgi:hypothetical protein
MAKAISKPISKVEELKRKLQSINSLKIEPTIKVKTIETQIQTNTNTEGTKTNTDVNTKVEVKKYHTGGIVGKDKLRPDEVPAILQTGEIVLSRDAVSKAKRTTNDLKGLEKFLKDLEKVAKKSYKNIEKASSKATKAVINSSKKKDKETNKSEKVLKKKLDLMKKEEQSLKEVQEFMYSIKNSIANNKGISTIYMENNKQFKEYAEKVNKLGNTKELQDLLIEYRRSTIVHLEKDKLNNYQPSQQGHILPDDYGIASKFSGTMKASMQSKEEIIKYYSEMKDIIKLKIEEINLEKQRGLISGLEAEQQINDLEIKMTKITADQKASIAQQEFETKLLLAKNTMGVISGTIDELLNAGLVKSKGMFEFMKALKVGEAIISTYAGASQALGNPALPYPMNIITSGLIIAKGMAQVAMIKAQQMPQPPRYHTGGYVDRPTANAQMGGLKDDEIPTILQKGEYVLNKDEVKQVKNTKVTNNYNSTGGAENVVVINTIDPQIFAQYLHSREGTKVIRNVVGRD